MLGDAIFRDCADCPQRCLVKLIVMFCRFNCHILAKTLRL